MISLLVFMLIFTVRTTAYAQSPGNGTSSSGWMERGETALAAGETERAVQLADSVLERAPDLVSARLLRARAYGAAARRTHFETPYAPILDANDLKKMADAAARVARGGTWDLDYITEHDVARAIVDFEFVLAQDSALHPALVDYGRLWHTHRVFDRAIEIGEASVRIHPDDPDAHVELVETYLHYIWRIRASEARQVLTDLGTPYATFFLGEFIRREGGLRRADYVLTRLNANRAGMPQEPILLSLAKVRIAQGRYQLAFALIKRALQFDDLVGARLVHRELWYVLDEAELAEAEALQTASDYRAFYERVWAKRDPSPAAPTNWRLVEHVRRLIVAENDFAYFGSRKRPMGDLGDPVPAYVMDVDLPPWYYDVHGFNDKGLIYIRYGEPDERIRTRPQMAMPPDPGVPENASWRYRAEGLDFHFVKSHDGGEAYASFLAAAVGECHLAADRAEWGGPYQQIAPRPVLSSDDRAAGPMDPCGGGIDSRSIFEVGNALATLIEEGQQDITTGLSSDRHTWPIPSVEGFDFPTQLATFRGEEGRTDVSIYFALPIGAFSRMHEAETVPVEVGFAVHDSAWHALAESNTLRRYPRSDDPTKATFEEIHFSVAPDSYRVSLYADLLGAPSLGGYRFNRGIDDYARPATMMSDLVLAYDIRPRAGTAGTTRSSLRITPNPFHRASTDLPLHVYFELYNLALTPDDLARYRITYRIEPTKEHGGIFGLFGRSDPGLAVSASFEDATPAPIVYQQIDVSDLSPGEYTLTVLVADETSGVELFRSIDIELY